MSRASTAVTVTRAFALLLLVSAAKAAAQPGTKTASNTLTTTIGGVFDVTPVPVSLTQNAQSGNLCSPGACYTGTLTAKGNRGWQLQVRLASTPAAFYVNYVQTTTPASAQAVNSGTQTRLNTTTWLTVARSTTATAGTPIGVQFNANKNSGNGGAVPTAAQLSAVLAWQVIAYP